MQAERCEPSGSSRSISKNRPSMRLNLQALNRSGMPSLETLSISKNRTALAVPLCSIDFSGYFWFFAVRLLEEKR